MAGPGLPGDMQPGDDGKYDFLKPVLGCLFHKAGPGLPRDRQPGDNDKKNDPKAIQKSRPWAAF